MDEVEEQERLRLRARLLEEVWSERVRQDALHGDNHDLPLGMFPEAAIHMAEAMRKTNEQVPSWMGILLEELYEVFAETDREQRRTELVQVAALAIKMAEML